MVKRGGQFLLLVASGAACLLGDHSCVCCWSWRVGCFKNFTVTRFQHHFPVYCLFCCQVVTVVANDVTLLRSVRFNFCRCNKKTTYTYRRKRISYVFRLAIFHKRFQYNLCVEMIASLCIALQALRWCRHNSGVESSPPPCRRHRPGLWRHIVGTIPVFEQLWYYLLRQRSSCSGVWRFLLMLGSFPTPERKTRGKSRVLLHTCTYTWIRRFR